jgi:V/A-type H+-transporting ATPase subunit B
MDLGWQTLAECFRPEELFMQQALIDKYFMPRYQRLQRDEETDDGATAAESDLVA